MTDSKTLPMETIHKESVILKKIGGCALRNGRNKTYVRLWIVFIVATWATTFNYRERVKF